MSTPTFKVGDLVRTGANYKVTVVGIDGEWIMVQHITPPYEAYFLLASSIR